MQTATSTLAAAIAAPEQQPAKAVRIDWGGDGYGPQGQLAVNPDMESTDLSAWLTYVPSGSYTQAAGIVSAISGQVVGSVTAPAPHAGTQQMAVTWPQNAGSAGSMVGQRLATIVGQQYQVAVWVQVPVGSQPVKARAQGVADSAASSGTGSWQQLTVTFTATKPTTIVGVVLPQATTTTTYYVFVDDFTVTPINPADYDTVTDLVSAISIDRTFDSGLPDAVLHPAGYTSAELTLNLGDGPAGVPAPVAHSPYNTSSPLYGRRPLARPVTVDLGMRTGAGVEVLRQFTGRTRSRAGQPGGDVEIRALDLAELMRGQATIPLVIGDDTRIAGPSDPDPLKPGLNSQWLVEWLFRQVGYGLSPLPRPGCVLSMTMHGSLWPEIGSIGTAYRTRFDSTPKGRVQSTPGKFGLALDTDTSAGWYTIAGGFLEQATLSSNPNAALVIEGWAKAPTTAWPDNSSFDGFLKIHNGAVSELASLRFKSIAGALSLIAQRSSSVTVTVTGPTLPTDGQWHYLAVRVTFTSSTSVTATFRVDGATTSPAAVTHAAVPTVVAFTSWGLDSLYPALEGWQVSPAPAVSWLDTWTPTAVVDTGLNDLWLMPDEARAGSIWDLLGTISEAELGFVSWNEAGTPVWRNSRWWSTAGQTAAVATITSQDALIANRVEEGIDAVRNRVTAGTSRPTISPGVVIWTASQVYSVPAGQTIAIIADLGGSGYVGLDGPLFLWPYLYAGATSNSMFACSNPDGSGTQITSGVSGRIAKVDSTATITVTNSTGSTVYLVNPVGIPNAGLPSVILGGLPVDWNTLTSSRVDVSDPASIVTYGEQVYALPDSQLRQNPDAVKAIANQLLAWLHRPHPAVTDVEIVGDPRLQLGDRIVLKDLDTGAVLGEEHWLVGIHTTLDDRGLTQRLDLRQATSPGGWVLGRTSPVNRTRLGVSTHLADI